MTFDISTVIRPNILNLKPYRCARDDYSEGMLLDANENAYGPMIAGLQDGSELHRYPDPHQVTLKELMANYRNNTSAFKSEGLAPISYKNICLGVGSDEGVDSLIRATCVPKTDKVLVLPPTYSMYSVFAMINDTEVVECPLITEDNSFDMDLDNVLETLSNDDSIKLLFITTPGNPTGASISTQKIEMLLNNWSAGIVVVDEAYIDFSSSDSAAPLVNKYPNLVVIQTLSKSFGLAGVRLGLTFASEDISKVLNVMKAPYNISKMASEIGISALQPESLLLLNKVKLQIDNEKLRVVKVLDSLDYVDKCPVGGLDANFIMVRVKDQDSELAKNLCHDMAVKSGIVMRFRGDEPGCEGCIRITIGTPEENSILIREFSKTLTDLVEK
ncbi:histidinol-phosphate transaminase Ecym_3290 [Eremothecium cymbalariae DBVPG|uniref:histidinol-phosphate transaminase n=1 Tax=Eremothecium cymbalariae (strain CBS 270.75 / DBVPG 7215 / KCTC 17166 / NRRL Y-17582) TaxID=931890 RepID=G8JRL4_ERECY|nr:Hypothetical protein Ecym_3290 [Eremothecium cymbalariae DBVPG\